MRIGAPRSFKRTVAIAAAGVLSVVLTACTGRGGGYLPPGASLGTGVVYTGPASFGFQFSCEDKGGTNPPTGRLSIQLAYNEQGTYLVAGKPFGIHGTVDIIDPVLESMICIGQNPPEPIANQLIFLGRYRPTTSAPAGFPTTCPTRETTTAPLCRFEVIVRDNDGNFAPSTGDFFSIKLSGSAAVTSELDPATVIYARAGLLQGGNITVK